MADPIQIEFANDQQLIALHDALQRAEVIGTRRAEAAKRPTIWAAVTLSATREALALVRDAVPDHLRDALGLEPPDGAAE